MLKHRWVVHPSNRGPRYWQGAVGPCFFLVADEDWRGSCFLSCDSNKVGIIVTLLYQVGERGVCGLLKLVTE